MELYNVLKNIEIDHHQMHIEEYLYQKKINKKIEYLESEKSKLLYMQGMKDKIDKNQEFFQKTKSINSGIF